MFGTLVIQLPSNYSGGEVAIYHQSKSMTFDFGGLVGCHNFHYAAFYADCQHEIKPVTKGYRLCLIYNLVCSGSDRCPVPADNQQMVSDIISSMVEWNGSTACPPMMTYLLEHQYCDASLSFRLLKNGDRAVADVLTQAKNEVEFDLYLAKVNMEQNWTASCSYDDYSPDELMREDIAALNLKSRNGRTISSINLDKEYFVPEDFFDNIDPDNEEFEEATGNAGATLDRQYSWAALLLWPCKNREINAGFSNVILSLRQDLLDQTLSKDKRAGLKTVAEDILGECAQRSSADDYVLFLQSLKSFGDTELILRFLKVSAPFLYKIIGNSSLCNEIFTMGCEKGWHTFGPFFQALTHGMSKPIEFCGFLHRLSQGPLSEDRKGLCEMLANSMVNVMSKSDDSRHHSKQKYVLVLQGLQNLGNVELISRFLMAIASSEVFHSTLITSSSFTKEILCVCCKYGWDILRSPLQVIAGKISSDVEKYSQFLHALSQNQPLETIKDVCHCLATAILNALSKEKDIEAPKLLWHRPSHSTSRNEEFLMKTFRSFMTLEYQLLPLVQVVCSKPNRYPVIEMLVPVCEDLSKSLKREEQKEPLKQLITYGISTLKVSTIPSPSDWSVPVAFSCSCQDCGVLIRFLKHSTETQHQFKMVQGRRSHLEDQLRCCVAISCSTERHGRRPHTLVVTKTQAIYKKRFEEHQRETAALSRLQSLIGGALADGEPSVKRQKIVGADVVDLT